MIGNMMRSRCVWAWALILAVQTPAAWAQGRVGSPGPSEGVRLTKGVIGPDVTCGSINGVARLAGDGTRTSYSVGTTSCNGGDQPLAWASVPSDAHPVIGQNMYRLQDGRFEHIGQAWLKHGFCAAQGFLCSTPENPCAGGAGCLDVLNPGCSDPYTTSNNALQSGLGPKWQVNPVTGVFPINPVPPYWNQGEGVNDPFDRRLIVQNTDLDPTLNPTAAYFVEGQYISQDDAAAGNCDNNASYREVSVGAAPNYTLSLVGATFAQTPALQAWQDDDPGVTLTPAAVPDDGLFILGHRVTDNGNGTWHYEYALYNMNSHEGARQFSVPVGPGTVVSNIGFHDVDYHSGDGEGGTNVDGTDWPAETIGNLLTWSTDDYADDPRANALRWGTLYNFRFDADQPPQAVTAVIGLYRSSNQMVLLAAEGPQAACPACDDADVCTADGCDVGAGCTHDAVTCIDGKLCTTDSCSRVSGCVFTAVNCDDGDACTDDGCDPGSGDCLHAVVDCDDADACTADSCDAISGCVNDASDCDDGDACTVDGCDPLTGRCEHDLVHCADGDFCTNDSCNVAIGCINDPVDCDDGDACTADSCNPASGCVHTALNCNDGDACTLDGCDSQSGCTHDPVDCSDGDACTADSCNPASGACGHDAVDCDDSDLCTTDSCNPASGCAHDPVDCDDGLACTTDDCDDASGACGHAAVDCDDRDPCTLDSCIVASGACLNQPLDCSDGDPCTLDVCQGGVCQNNPLPCDDGLFCNGLETCVAGVCLPGSDPCPQQRCDEDQQRCVLSVYDFDGVTSPSATHTAEDGEIDVSSMAIGLGDFNARRDFIPGWANWSEASTQEYANLVGSDDQRYQSSDPGGGDNAAMIFEFIIAEDRALIESIEVNIEVGRPTSSSDRAFVYLWNYRLGEYLVGASTSNTSDTVLSFIVALLPSDYVQANGGQLTVFVVNQQTSELIRVDDLHVVVDAPPCMFHSNCEDGTVCTVDTCNLDGTCNHDSIDCNDGLFCTVDTCNPASGCVHSALNCSDGDACTADSCSEVNGCVHEVIVCQDADLCTTDTCDPASGCVFDAVDCSDGDACTTDGCDPGVGCTYGAVDCSDGTVCTIDSCDPAEGCQYQDVACDDGNACTDDYCDPLEGCVHAPADCSDSQICTVDTCDPLSGCVYTPLNCSDDNACTADACQPGLGCMHAPIICDDDNRCTDDSCDPGGGCVFEPNADPCDDDNVCTSDDTCQEGRCLGDPVTCDFGAVCVDGICLPPNDDCADAVAIGPGEVVGSTVDATADPTAPSPCNAFVTSPGVWYSITGTGNTLTVSGCASDLGFEPKLNLYTPSCDDLGCIVGIQSCTGDVSPLLTAVSWCSVLDQQYLILVHGFSGHTGPFVLTVTDGSPCTLCGSDEDCAPGRTCDQGNCEPAPICGQPESGDCLDRAGTGSPGCADEACCLSVCSQQSYEFCCQVEWDATCAIQAQLLCTTADPCQVADLSGDGLVNAADLAVLLGAWGPNPGHPADFNGDGVVNAADLAQLLGTWGPVAVCDDRDPCTTDSCDSGSGVCVFERVPCGVVPGCDTGRCEP